MPPTDTSSNGHKFNFTVHMMIQAVGLVGWAVTEVIDAWEPTFWTDAAAALIYLVRLLTGIFFIFFIFATYRLHKKTPLPDKTLARIYILLAIAYIIVLNFLVVRTGGLWLSPFSEFYAAILVTVLIIAPLDFSAASSSQQGSLPNNPSPQRPNFFKRKSTLVALAIFISILIHLLLDPRRVPSSLFRTALEERHAWEYSHGVFFFLVILGIFIIDWLRDHSRHTTIESLRRQLQELQTDTENETT